MNNDVLERRERLRNETVTMKKWIYQRNLGRASIQGAVMALLKVGKEHSEIAEILNLKESHVRHLVDKVSDWVINKESEA